MQIKTLRKQSLPFPEIGRIRKGAPKEEGAAPKDLDYFRVDIFPHEEKAIEDFSRHYPDEPKEINIRFPFNEINSVWMTALEAYTAGAMYAQSDGEIYIYLKDGMTGDILVKDGIDLETGEPRPYKEDEPATHYTNSKGEKIPLHCKPTGRLRVMIAELKRAAFFTVVTNSWNDIEQITAQLNGLDALSNGNIQGLPIQLKRRPKMVSTPGANGKRVRREKYLIELEVDPEYTAARFDELKRQVMPSLSDGGETIDAEIKEIPATNAPTVEGETIRWTSHQLGLCVTKNLAQDMNHAEEMLNLSSLDDEVDDAVLLRWLRKYMAHKDESESSEMAAGRANAAYERWKEKQNG